MSGQITQKNLSIIVPIFNNCEDALESLKNILAQSAYNIELICIDDGSTDDSAKIVEGLACKDSRIKLIKQENQGAGAARNAGIKAAKGEYIAFMDADDYYPSNDILARLYSTAKANNALICGGSFCEVKDGGIISSFQGDMSGNTFVQEGWVDFFDYQFDYAFYRFIYQREFLLKNNLFFPQYRRYQDPPFMLRAFAAAGKFYAVPDITYCYRVNASKTVWTTEKVFDLLCGIEDNLIFSAQCGYAKVHNLNYKRLCNDFSRNIVDTALQFDSDGEIIKKLIEIQAVVNKEFLVADGTFTQNALVLSDPLAELISLLSKQSTQVKSEGWFINKKFFRIYTWPVRVVGKWIRAIRRKH